MKIKTEKLTGAALDWAVARCEGGKDLQSDGITWFFNFHGVTRVLTGGWAPSMSYSPSTEWSRGGPIIEREGIELRNPRGAIWWADRIFPESANRDDWCGNGPTPLVAAMRCYVGGKLGEEVDVPEGLLE